MATTDITRQPLTGPAEAQAHPASAGSSQRTRLIGVTAVLVGSLTAAMYAAITGVSDWSQLVVLGGIALVTIGLMIAIDPLRQP